MSRAQPQYEVGAVVLGYVGNVATWRRAAAGKPNDYAMMLTIQTASSVDDGVHVPAESVTLHSREGLLALRQAIDEALKEYPK